MTIFLCFLLALDFLSFFFFFLDLLESELVETELSEQLLFSDPSFFDGGDEEEEEDDEEEEEEEESDGGIVGASVLVNIDLGEFTLTSWSLGVTDITCEEWVVEPDSLGCDTSTMKGTDASLLGDVCSD